MGERVEQLWRMPEALPQGRGGLAMEELGVVRPLWPGIQEGRPRPEFAYAITTQEYLTREDVSDGKHELVDGFVYAMAGASDAHVTITDNLAVAIKPRIRGSGCRGYGPDMKLAMPDVGESSVGGQGTFYYPDYIVTCSKADREPSADMMKREPCLVIEVLSASTATTDRTEKYDRYRRIPTLAQYWLVEQDRRRIVVYERSDTGWTETEYTDPHSTIALPVDGVEIRVEDVYLDVFDG